jgi:hypothetical protein
MLENRNIFTPQIDPCGMLASSFVIISPSHSLRYCTNKSERLYKKFDVSCYCAYSRRLSALYFRDGLSQNYSLCLNIKAGQVKLNTCRCMLQIWVDLT